MIVVVKYAFEEVRNWVEEAPAKEAREGTEAVQATPARREVFQADQVPAVRPEGEEEAITAAPARHHRVEAPVPAAHLPRRQGLRRPQGPPHRQGPRRPQGPLRPPGPPGRFMSIRLAGRTPTTPTTPRRPHHITSPPDTGE